MVVVLAAVAKEVIQVAVAWVVVSEAVARAP